MTIKPFSDLEPISKHTFRKHIHKSYLVQIFYISVIFTVIKYTGFSLPNSKTISFFVLLFILSVLSFTMIFDLDIYRSRFKAIYPDSVLSYWKLLPFCFFPLAFIVMTIFFYFKEPEKHIRQSLNYRYALLALLPILSAEIVNTKMAYLIGSPAMYYVSDVTADSIELLKLSKSKKTDNDLVSNFIKKHENMSALQTVLLMAVSINHLKRELESQKKTKTMEPFLFGTKVLEDSHKLLAHSEKNKFQISSYSLIHWLYPAGPFQIVMFEATDKGIYRKMNKVIFEKNKLILAKLQMKVYRLPAGEREKMSKKLKDIESNYDQTETSKYLIQNKLQKSFLVK